MKILPSIRFLTLGLLFFPAVNFAQAPVYTPAALSLFANESLEQNVGSIEAGVPVHVLQTSPQANLIELEAWRKTKGFGRVWYNQFSKQIIDAIFAKEFVQNPQNFEVLEQKEDPITGLVWQKIRTKVWVTKAEFTPDLTALWAETERTYKTECSVCHKQRDTKMHDANEWVAVFNGMQGFTDMDEETSKKVLRYLQLHASDASQEK